MPEEKFLLSVEISFQAELDNGDFSDPLRAKFSEKAITLSSNVAITIVEAGNRWLIADGLNNKAYSVLKESELLNIYEKQERDDEDPDNLIDQILSDEQLRQAIENRIFSSFD
jgi:hypothetical protein